MTDTKTEAVDVLEAPSPERRRRYSAAQKEQLLREAAEPGNSISQVARRFGISPSLLSRWKRMQGRGRTGRSRRPGAGGRRERGEGAAGAMTARPPWARPFGAAVRGALVALTHRGARAGAALGAGEGLDPLRRAVCEQFDEEVAPVERR